MKATVAPFPKGLSKGIIVILLSIFLLPVAAQDSYTISDVKKACLNNPAQAKILLDSIDRKARADNYQTMDKPSIDFLYGIIYTFTNKQHLSAMYFERVMKSDESYYEAEQPHFPEQHHLLGLHLHRWQKSRRLLPHCLPSGLAGRDEAAVGRC